MVRNFESGGGKKHKRTKNNRESNTSRELVFKEDGQEYGIVQNIHGGKRCTVKLQNKLTCLGIIRGNMKKNTSRVHLNDIVLVSIRDFQESKVDIIHVYNIDEVRSLIAYEEIDENFGKQDMEQLLSDNIIFENI